MSDVPFGNVNPIEKNVEAGRRKRTSFRIRLRSASGTVLAACPNREAGLRTARAMFDGVEAFERSDGTWELRSGGSVVATIGR